MPKKVQGRSAKSKSKSRRPQQRPNRVPGAEAVAVPQATTSTVTAAATATTAAPASRRGGSRRPPTITINYAYLRHDIMTLGVLAPLMVVLLFIAYIVFHTA